MVEDAKAQREVRRFDLAIPMPWARDALVALLVTVWLGLGFLWFYRGREDGTAASMRGPIWVLVAVVSLFFCWTVGAHLGEASGEAAIRSALARFDVGNLKQFTTPEGSWRYTSPLFATGLVSLVMAILGGGIRWIPHVDQKFVRHGVGAGALLILAGCTMQLLSVGGLPWRPEEGALWGAAILVGSAWLDGDGGLKSALPCVLALGLCGLAMA